MRAPQTKRPARRRQAGMSLVELMISMLLLTGTLIGILPVMYRASLLDRGSQNTTGAAYAGTQIMETLKLYRAIQLDGGTIPSELAAFTPDTPHPYEIDGTGFWALLNLDANRYDMSYTLTNDPTTNRLVARVTVRSQDPLAESSGGDKWIEFLSAIE